MKRTVKVLTIMLIGIFLLGPDCPPEEPPEALQVVQAIADLHHPDYVVVRNAIRKLKLLMDAPNIGLAIRPLSNILLIKHKYYDSYTRGMAAYTLVKIAKVKGWPQEKKAIQPVIDELGSGRIDTVRASCAYALGMSGMDTVIDPLINANEQDTSPLVRQVACESLMLLTNGHYSSETCQYEESATTQSPGSPGAMQKRSQMLASETSTLSSGGSGYPDELQWARNHILLPLDSLITPADQNAGYSE